MRRTKGWWFRFEPRLRPHRSLKEIRRHARSRIEGDQDTTYYALLGLLASAGLTQDIK
jgi:hypothetical protein